MKLLIVVAAIGFACILPALSQQESRTKQLTRNPFLPANVTKPTVKPRNPFLPTSPSISRKITAKPTSRSRPKKPKFKNKPLTPKNLPKSTEPAPITPGSCRGPDLLNGVCTPLASCQPLLTKLQKNSSDVSFIDFLRKSNEICGKEYAVVCCPSSNQDQSQDYTNGIPTRLPTMEEGCGAVNHLNNVFNERPGVVKIQVVGGKPSKIRAWPWIALIGYDDGVSSSPFKCGGALITSRHVLTAAHCIRSDLTFIRLGEHDLSTDLEAKHVDVPVRKTLRHPNYSRIDGRNDVALLYLAQNVQFTETIGPICLPITNRLRTKSFVDSSPFVAGWGRTLEGGKTATVLQELQIPVLNNSFCRDLYKKQSKLVSEQQFDNSVICAGVLEGGKDTCQGDSGGPLMLPEIYRDSLRFHMIGIVSYSIGCARPEIPGVYSRVANFIEWIQNGIADTT